MAKAKPPVNDGGEGGEGEDNRDIFEKALDYAAPALVAGAGIGGAILGSLPGSKQARKILSRKTTKPLTQAEVDILNKMDRTTLPKMLAGGALGMGGAGVAVEKMSPSSNKRRK